MLALFRLDTEVVLKGMLHVAGLGRPRPLVDRCVAVDEHGVPYLPASSVRGRVRAHLERLLRAWGLPVCAPPRPERMCPHACLEGTEGGYCLACRLFGSPWRDGAVVCEDFRPQGGPGSGGAEPHTWDGLMVVRTGVGIGRKLGTVREERLFFTEALPRVIAGEGLRFGGALEVRAEPAELGWLVAAMRLVTHLGAQKGRGLGRVELRVTGVARWDGRDWVSEDPGRFCEEVVGLALAGGAAR
mgnify:CR=1 FL=1